MSNSKTKTDWFFRLILLVVVFVATYVILKSIDDDAKDIDQKKEQIIKLDSTNIALEAKYEKHVIERTEIIKQKIEEQKQHENEKIYISTIPENDAIDFFNAYTSEYISAKSND